MNEPSPTDHPSSYRWAVLLVFMLIALISQLLWLTFAPISSEMAALLNVTTNDISLLSLVWPIIFVILAIPVGVYIDKKGFVPSVRIAALFIAIFSILRVLATMSNNFIFLLLAQSGTAISQPFIFGSITKLSVQWFPHKEQGLATGLGTIGLFLGMMLALVLTPFLFLAFGATMMLIIVAAISCIGALLFFLVAREGTMITTPETSAAFSLRDLGTLSKKRDFAILEYGFFVCIGGFTAILTWLEVMLNSLHGITIEQAGIAGGVMIIGGIIGSIAIPTLSDKIHRIKPLVLINLAIGTISFYLITVFQDALLLFATSFVMGFFLMSALPLVLEISNKISGTGMEGRASSLLWFFSQVGSIALIALIDPVKSLGGSYFYSVMLIVILWAAAFIFFMDLEETHQKKTT